jgi:hypothetical protein
MAILELLGQTTTVSQSMLANGLDSSDWIAFISDRFDIGVARDHLLCKADRSGKSKRERCGRRTG